MIETKTTIDQLLPAEVVSLLEEKHITCHISCQLSRDEGQEYDYIVEMEFFSPKDGDQIHTAWLYEQGKDEEQEDYLLRNLEKFRKECEDIYECFDVDEFVMMWLDAPDKCPLGAVDLVHEAEWIDEFLKDLSDRVDQINDKLNR